MDYLTEVNKCYKVIEQLQWERQIAKEKRKELKLKIKKNVKKMEALEKCKAIVTTLSEKIQENTVRKLENIISSALQSVFDSDLEAIIKMEQKRDQQEATFYLKKGDIELELRHDVAAVGEVDVFAFGAKMGFWSLDEKAIAILLFDEPFKNLSEEYLPAAGQFLKYIADKLRIQIIIISHEEGIIEYADNIIRIK